MKKFILQSLWYFVPFICICGIVIFRNSHISGDLGNLAKITFGKEYEKLLAQNYLTNNYVRDTLINTDNHLEFDTKSTILTIGDSFSLYGQGNYRYLNYLAYLFHYDIVNIERKDHHAPVQDAIKLLNSGIIDSATCKAVIVETVDRNAIERLSGLDFDRNYSAFQKQKKAIPNNQKTTLLTLCQFIKLQLGYKNPVFNRDLMQNCFSHHDYSNKLFCYKGDMGFKKISKENIETSKENLILLNKKFSDKGIKIIFLIAADKYDVYRPFMMDNTLPVDTTTDDLNNVCDICIINTKSMLQKMVRDGEKDVYKVNDTHWSYKASKAVAEKIACTIDSLGVLK